MENHTDKKILLNVLITISVLVTIEWKDCSQNWENEYMLASYE